LSLAAQQALLTYSWPGNVRELENVVQRALVFCSGEEIDSDHLVFDEMEPADESSWLKGSATPVVQPTEDRSALFASESRTQSHHSDATSAHATGTNQAEYSKGVEFVGPPTREAYMALVSEQGQLVGSSFLGQTAPNTAKPFDFVGPVRPEADAVIGTQSLNVQASNAPIRLPDLVKTNERQVILAALESAPTKAEAARRLGISPRTLRYKMAQLRMAGAA
jgi:two-component system response regulator FlrC